MSGNETLMNLRPQGDSEKLIWAREDIKVLKEDKKVLSLEIGYLKSELDELRYTMSKDKVGQVVLSNNKLKKKIQDLENKIKDYKKTNEQLMQKVIRLQINK